LKRAALRAQRAAEAARAARRAADDAWVAEALSALRWVARGHAYVVADDVWTRLRRAPREGRALGAVFRRACAMRLVEPTARFVTTLQPERHGAPVRVWRSLCHGGGDERFVEGELYSREALARVDS